MHKIYNKCLLCGNFDLEKMFYAFSKDFPLRFHSVVVCKKCGHIQLSPVYSVDQYKNINEKSHVSYYLRKGKRQEEQLELRKPKKVDKIEKYLSPYIKRTDKVLDIGAGHGLFYEFFKSKGCDYYAIEPIKSLSKLILHKGGIVIGEDINAPYERFHNYFDVIIVRHLLEHLLEPSIGLKNALKLLRPDGVLCLVLPNGAVPSCNSGFLTDYIRPTHISYFHPKNIVWLIQENGLSILDCDYSSEIFMILRNSKAYSDNILENQYGFMKTLYIATFKKNFLFDLIKIARDIF